MYQIRLSKEAQKHLEKIESRYQRLIVKALDKLAEDPTIGVPLNGELKGNFKFRVSHFRIIYQIENMILVVFVVDINHRKDIYR